MPDDDADFKVESTTFSEVGVRDSSEAAGETLTEDSVEASPPDETTPPSEAVEEAAEIESSASEELEEQEEEEPPAAKPKRSAANRIDQLTRNWRETERRLEDAERRLAAVQQQPQPPQPQAPPAQPQVDDFDTYEEYMQKSIDWGVQKGLSSERQAQARQQAVQAQFAQDQQWKQQMETSAQTHEDFEEVVSNPNIPVSPIMSDAMKGSPVGAEIMYWLGQNPAHCEQIAYMPPLDALKEIGKLEWSIQAQSAQAPQDPPAPAPKVSSAPKPIRPVGGKGDSSPTSGYRPDMTMDEYNAWRDKSSARAAG